MKNKVLFTGLFALLILSAKVFSQTTPTINKMPTSDGKKSLYIASYPIMARESNDKSIMLAPQFTTDDKTDSLSGITGLRIFAKGLGKCFLRDTLQLSFENGKKLKMISASPMLCDQPLSGWFNMNKEELSTLFSSPIIQINFLNAKSGETFTQDFTDKNNQEYFIEIKKVFDMLAMQKPA